MSIIVICIDTTCTTPTSKEDLEQYQRGDNLINFISRLLSAIGIMIQKYEERGDESELS